ncbi:hypothetical protein [Candidatus Thiothrix anitrata]|uniref:Uncharacterized protein n=1 Tax=Candidatus Thiothrix anitrata TaxID=2823902 RepID=A0ABX7X800_9GAMM|nr:hypothetical protein [Candidatus Thiothrix anitrata]QTR50804.1 hypothetical protein J8380_04330 [Candidatus Thiothrix anitrata]
MADADGWGAGGRDWHLSGDVVFDSAQATAHRSQPRLTEQADERVGVLDFAVQHFPHSLPAARNAMLCVGVEEQRFKTVAFQPVQP